jgi:hypothetical protein
VCVCDFFGPFTCPVSVHPRDNFDLLQLPLRSCKNKTEVFKTEMFMDRTVQTLLSGHVSKIPVSLVTFQAQVFTPRAIKHSKPPLQTYSTTFTSAKVIRRIFSVYHGAQGADAWESQAWLVYLWPNCLHPQQWYVYCCANIYCLKC